MPSLYGACCATSLLDTNPRTPAAPQPHSRSSCFILPKIPPPTPRDSQSSTSHVYSSSWNASISASAAAPYIAPRHPDMEQDRSAASSSSGSIGSRLLIGTAIIAKLMHIRFFFFFFVSVASLPSWVSCLRRKLSVAVRDSLATTGRSLL